MRPKGNGSQGVVSSLQRLDERLLGGGRGPKYDEPVPRAFRVAGSFGFWSLAFLVGEAHFSSFAWWVRAGFIVYAAVVLPLVLAALVWRRRHRLHPGHF